LGPFDAISSAVGSTFGSTLDWDATGNGSTIGGWSWLEGRSGTVADANIIASRTWTPFVTEPSALAVWGNAIAADAAKNATQTEEKRQSLTLNSLLKQHRTQHQQQFNQLHYQQIPQTPNLCDLRNTGFESYF